MIRTSTQKNRKDIRVRDRRIWESCESCENADSVSDRETTLSVIQWCEHTPEAVQGLWVVKDVVEGDVRERERLNWENIEIGLVSKVPGAPVLEHFALSLDAKS
jgi:hypothetical protein